MRYTQATLNKIEQVLDDASYIVRYERGTFQSGYCILEQKKVVVLNKFLPLEGRINTLVDIIPQLKVNPIDLSPDSGKTIQKLWRSSGLPGKMSPVKINCTKLTQNTSIKF